MRLAKVVGTVVATHKDPKLCGAKFLLVEDVDLEGRGQGTRLVAFDAVGAGFGEVVLYAQGSSARQTTRTEGCPVDCTIMAIVDIIETEGKPRYVKGTGEPPS